VKPSPPYPSIAAIGKDMGVVAAEHMDRAFRRMLHGTRVVSERRFVRLSTGEPHPFGNFAFISDPNDLGATQAAMEPFDVGVPTGALFPGPVSPAVANWLHEAGFESQGVMPAMAVEIESLRASALPAGYSLIAIESAPELDEFAEAFANGFELPRGVVNCFLPCDNPSGVGADGPLSYFAIRKEGRMVSTSAMYLDNGVAGIYCVATVPEERSKGLGAHVTAQPLRRAYRLGYRVGVLQSTRAGYPVYKRLGFADFGEVPMFVRMPA
jgi:hypothetical protein